MHGSAKDFAMYITYIDHPQEIAMGGWPTPLKKYRIRWIRSGKQRLGWIRLALL